MARLTHQKSPHDFGLLLPYKQWGVGALKAASETTFYYPIKFNAVAVPIAANTQGSGSVAPINLSSVLVTSFAAHAKDNGVYHAETFNWIAIGY